MAMKWEGYHKLSPFIYGLCTAVTTGKYQDMTSAMSLIQVAQERGYA